MAEEKSGYGKISLIISYVIFGTIGILVRYIPLSSGIIAALRGLVGCLFIFMYKLLIKSTVDRIGIKNNLVLLVISGGVIGFNWIFLFEAYRYTSIATATLCYYMAPVFVSLAAPFVLKEKFSARRGVAVFVAFLGMFFSSGVMGEANGSFTGVALGLAAAFLYAVAIVCNKKMSKIESTDRAMLQLGIAGAALVPYVLINENLTEISIDATGVVLLFVAAVVHTGVAYVLNLGAVGKTPAQTVAVLSYLDPVVAIIAAAAVFGEIPDVEGVIGIVLVLGAAIIGEAGGRRR